jgi:aldehyde:ferredoxin oxidoreductase
MAYGYAGRILRIDLSQQETKDEPLDMEWMRKLLGGRGYAAKILFEEVGPKVDPLSGENRLIIMTTPLVGSGFICGNKIQVVARSPLTGIWGDATFSPRFGLELKKAGYDGIVVQGASIEPVYVWIKDGKTEIRNASGLWGKDSYETFESIKKELGDENARIVGIGPSGEKQLKLACIVSDDGRAAGRGGMGAVMGSKKLKAISARGTGKTEFADKDKIVALSTEAIKTVLPRTQSLRKFGTSGAVAAFEEIGNLPVRNWTRQKFLGASNVSGQRMSETILTRSEGCHACPIACGRYVEVREGPYKTKGFGPEYETIAMLGPSCGVDNLEAVAKANDLCFRYGMDTISVGGTVAFAMECFEHGLITEDTVGLELAWGNHEALVKLTEQICRKESFGAVLCDGSEIAAERIGKGSKKYAMQVKGMELPAHNPYRFKCMGLNYATSNRGADHNRGSPAYVARGFTNPEIGPEIGEKYDGFSPIGMGKATKTHQDACAVVDCVGICKFAQFQGGLDFNMLTDVYNALTGSHVTLRDLMNAGERIWNLERAFNVRMGVTKNNDRLPERFLKESPLDGPQAGQVVELDQMLEEYYAERKLDEIGKPSREKLAQLGLDFVIEKLYGECQ